MRKNLKITRDMLGPELAMLVMVIENAKKHKDLGHTTRIYSQYLRYAMDEFAYVNLHQSDEAKGKTKKEVVRDHVVPHSLVMDKLFAIKELNQNSVWRVIKKYYIICSITKEEDRKLSSKGFKSKMPNGWCENEENLFARYEEVGINYSKQLT